MVMFPPSMADPPFACPPDPLIGGIILDLPPPISVNKVRRINWREHRRAMNWRRVADGYLMAAKARKEIRFDRIDRFELRITLNEDLVRCDADNSAKLLIDYLCAIEIIKDDAPVNMRKVTIEWGEAPLGCRVKIVPWRLS